MVNDGSTVDTEWSSHIFRPEWSLLTVKFTKKCSEDRLDWSMLRNCSVSELCYMSVKYAVRRRDDSFVGGTCVRPSHTYCANGALTGMRQNEAQPRFERCYV